MSLAVSGGHHRDRVLELVKITATGNDSAGLATVTFVGDGTRFAQISCGNATACPRTEWWITGALASGRRAIDARDRPRETIKDCASRGRVLDRARHTEAPTAAAVPGSPASERQS